MLDPGLLDALAKVPPWLALAVLVTMVALAYAPSINRRMKGQAEDPPQPASGGGRHAAPGTNAQVEFLSQVMAQFEKRAERAESRADGLQARVDELEAQLFKERADRMDDRTRYEHRIEQLERQIDKLIERRGS